MKAIMWAMHIWLNGMFAKCSRVIFLTYLMVIDYIDLYVSPSLHWTLVVKNKTNTTLIKSKKIKFLSNNLKFVL